MGEINEELVLLIKEAQGNRGQNQFAQQCDISSSSLTKISIGSYTPSAKFLAKIANHAHNGVTYEMLMNAAGYLTRAQKEKSPSNNDVLSEKDYSDGIDKKSLSVEQERLLELFNQIDKKYGERGQQLIIKYCELLLQTEEKWQN